MKRVFTAMELTQVCHLFDPRKAGLIPLLYSGD